MKGRELKHWVDWVMRRLDYDDAKRPYEPEETLGAVRAVTPPPVTLQQKRYWERPRPKTPGQLIKEVMR